MWLTTHQMLAGLFCSSLFRERKACPGELAL